MAQAESDAMQYTLPLKQKQIEQSRLEAEARKQTRLKTPTPQHKRAFATRKRRLKPR